MNSKWESVKCVLQPDIRQWRIGGMGKSFLKYKIPNLEEEGDYLSIIAHPVTLK